MSYLIRRHVVAEHRIEPDMTSGVGEDHPRDEVTSAGELIVQLSLDGRILWASPAVIEALGWSPRDILGQRLNDMVADDSLDLSSPPWGEVTGDVSATPLALRHRDGSTRRGRATFHAVTGVEGAQDTVIALLRGFHASGNVVLDQDLSQLLTQNIADVVSITEGEGRIAWVTPNVSTLLGRSANEVVNHHFREFVVAEDVAILSAALARIMSGEVVHFEVRLHHLERGVLSVAVASHLVDVPGLDRARVAVWRDVTEATRYRDQLLQSQQDLQRVAENASDVVVQTDTQGIVEWVSPSVHPVLGWRPIDVIGRNYVEFVAPTDTTRALAWQSLVMAGERVRIAQLRFRTGSSESRWMSVRAQPLIEGRVARGAIMSLRDSHEEVLTRRALNTLSAASRSLTRSEEEGELLASMCQVTVNEGGYLLCWYARPGAADPRHLACVASSEEHHSYAESAFISLDDDQDGRHPLKSAWVEGETVVVNDRLNDRRYFELDADARSRGFRATIALPVRCDRALDGVLVVEASDPGAFDASVIDVLEELAAQLGFGLQRLREHDRLVHSLSEQLLLGAAVEQSGESITITDSHANIVYANPATLRSSGYELDELVGRNPRIFQSGLQNRAFYEAMWRQISSGETWRGVLVNKRKDGELYEEEATVSSIHDERGELAAYVAVKRDLTLERNLQASLTSDDNDRNTILAIMREMRPVSSLEAMANLFCRLTTRLEGIDAVTLLTLHHNDELGIMGTHGEPFFADHPSLAIPASLVTEQIHLGDPARILDFDEPRWSESSEALELIRNTNVSGVVVAPLRWNDSTIGVLALATRDEHAAGNLPHRLAAFDQLGSYAGSFFGAQIEAQRHRESLRSEIQRIMDEGAFTSVFQPFVELATGRIVGYEALTRFDSGRRPDLCFMDAHQAGLGPDLEVACALASIDAARDLDAEIWLSLNFSPAALLGHYVEPILARANRQVVLEITEHDQIENYAAIRSVVAGLPDCRVAVDDAGAGFTSLAHILELQPDFVKLDISLIRNIDTNPAREAMTAGICHFAAQTDTVVIAEGVETAAEAETLLRIGTTLGQDSQMLGQGYFLGRPTTLDDSRGG